jgi:hypothetical protein
MIISVKEAIINFVEENTTIIEEAKKLKEEFDYEVNIQMTGSNKKEDITVEYWHYNPLTKEIEIKTSFSGVLERCFSKVPVGTIEVKRIFYPNGRMETKISRIIDFTDHWSSFEFLTNNRKEEFKKLPAYREKIKLENIKEQEKKRKNYPQKIVEGVV